MDGGTGGCRAFLRHAGGGMERCGGDDVRGVNHMKTTTSTAGGADRWWVMPLPTSRARRNLVPAALVPPRWWRGGQAAGPAVAHRAVGLGPPALHRGPPSPRGCARRTSRPGSVNASTAQYQPNVASTATSTPRPASATSPTSAGTELSIWTQSNTAPAPFILTTTLRRRSNHADALPAPPATCAHGGLLLTAGCLLTVRESSEHPQSGRPPLRHGITWGRAVGCRQPCDGSYTSAGAGARGRLGAGASQLENVKPST